MYKIFRSIIKLILPTLSNLFLLLRVNRRVINYLEDKSFSSNNNYNFKNEIKILLKDRKIFALDIGAQGGFNSDEFFHNKYKSFFEPIMVEPIPKEADKLKKNYKYVIGKGIWSSNIKKKLFILGNRLGSSSIYEPSESNLKMYGYNSKELKNFKITETVEIKCDTIDNSLEDLNIKKIDYLKIDTQGSELEILKGMKKYNPILIRVEVQIFSAYKNVPRWTELLSFLTSRDYILCDWKKIGDHVSRTPVEMEMLFIPNFKSSFGKKVILDNKEKFLSLMMIFGQIKFLQLISEELDLDEKNFLNKYEDRYFY